MRNILFLCTGNSARSIMAEAYMNHVGQGRWRAFSAGSQPTGKPNPFAFETLERHGVPLASGDGGAPRSKSWDAFAEDGAPLMDTVITVCDNAAGEICPIWPTAPGKPAPAKQHWSFPDPAAEAGSDAAKREAFERVFLSIRTMIDDFLQADA